MKVVMSGNPIDGFALFGPFEELDDTIAAQFEGDWWVVDVYTLPEQESAHAEPWTATHVSASDGSPAMLLEYGAPDAVVRLVNEDGHEWWDAASSWVEIHEEENPDRCQETGVRGTQCIKLRDHKSDCWFQ